MMKISVSSKESGNFSGWLEKCKKVDVQSALDEAGKEIVDSLKASTVVDTGQTRDSYNYEATMNVLNVFNTYIPNGTNKPLVLILNYGHATRGGTFVQGLHFLDSAFDSISITEKVMEVINDG